MSLHRSFSSSHSSTSKHLILDRIGTQMEERIPVGTCMFLRCASLLPEVRGGFRSATASKCEKTEKAYARGAQETSERRTWRGATQNKRRHENERAVGGSEPLAHTRKRTRRGTETQARRKKRTAQRPVVREEHTPKSTRRSTARRTCRGQLAENHQERRS